MNPVDRVGVWLVGLVLGALGVLAVLWLLYGMFWAGMGIAACGLHPCGM